MYAELTTYERRESIRLLLVRRKYAKVKDLVNEYGVTKQTILKDLVFLSSRIPITTKTGKCGGIFLKEEFESPREYLSVDEENLLLYISKSLNKSQQTSVPTVLQSLLLVTDGAFSLRYQQHGVSLEKTGSRM